MTDNPQFGIFIFDKSTGSLLKSLYEYDLSSSTISKTRNAVAIEMD